MFYLQESFIFEDVVAVCDDTNIILEQLQLMSLSYTLQAFAVHFSHGLIAFSVHNWA